MTSALSRYPQNNFAVAQQTTVTMIHDPSIPIFDGSEPQRLPQFTTAIHQAIAMNPHSYLLDIHKILLLVNHTTGLARHILQQNLSNPSDPNLSFNETYRRFYDTIHRNQTQPRPQSPSAITRILQNPNRPHPRPPQKTREHTRIHHGIENVPIPTHNKPSEDHPEIFCSTDSSLSKTAILIDAYIGGIPVKTMLDTGAYFNYIAPEIVKLITVKSTKPGNTIRSVDGTVMQKQEDSIIISADCQIPFFPDSVVQFTQLRMPKYQAVIGLGWCHDNAAIINTLTNSVMPMPTEYLASTPSHAEIQATWQSMVQIDDPGYYFAATSEAPTDEPEKIILPPQFQEFANIFDPEEAWQLPPDRPDFNHRIPLIKDAPMPHDKPRRLTPRENQTLDKLIQQYREAGWIVPSTSQYSSAIHFASKKDTDELRLTIDFRKLNKATEKCRFPSPNLDDCLDAAQNAQFLAKFDITSAFHRLMMHPDDQHLTAFTTPRGLYQWTVMPMGLHGATGSWQRLMNYLFKDLIADNKVKVYIDDILVLGTSRQDLDTTIRKVFRICQDNKIFLKLQKSIFQAQTLSFLGFIIDKGQIRIDPARAASFTQWPVPRNIKEVQRFLGATGFCRRFIKDYSKKARPLQSLIRKDLQTFIWTTDHQSAFDLLKKEFESTVCLQLFDYEKPVRIHTDASDFALGAVLEQQDGHRYRPVAFYSRKLSDIEVRTLTVAQKEFLAIIDALEHWRYYCEGTANPVEIRTDHRNFATALSQNMNDRKRAGWYEKLAKYNIEISWIMGKNNPADPLSRRPDYCENRNTKPAPQANIMLVDLDQDEQEINRTPLFPTTDSPETMAATLIDALHTDQSQLKPTDFIGDDDDDEWEFDEHHQVWKRRGKIYVPEKTRPQLLHENHDSAIAGHLGRDKTLARIIALYWWPTMRHDISEYVAHCHTCQANKHSRQKPMGKLHPLPPPERPWSRIHIDFIGPFPHTKNGNDLILLVVDSFSKMIHLHPVPHHEATSLHTARNIERNIVKLHGIPSTIVSDQGTQFTSLFFRTLATHLRIKLQPTSAYHPQGDGQAERVNSTLKAYLRSYCDKQKQWDEYLWIAEACFNSSKHATTQISPFRACQGWEPRFTIQKEIPGKPLTHAEAQNRAQDILDIWASTKTLLDQAQKNMGKYYDAKHNDVELQIGDQVMLKLDPAHSKVKLSSMITPKKGPFTIIATPKPQTYSLDLPKDSRIDNNFHISRLERYLPPLPFQPQPEPIIGRLAELNPNIPVTGILDSRLTEDGFQYLAYWKNSYRPKDITQKWIYPPEIPNADAIDAFHATCPDKPRPTNAQMRKKPPQINWKLLEEAEEADRPLTPPPDDI